MTKVDFYHLQKQTLEEVLPKLLEKAYETGKKVKVKVGNEERVEFINSLLWTYNDFSFLPHGSKKDGNAALQPIWLSVEDDNPNGALYLFLVDGAKVGIEELQKYERVFNIFDGNSGETVGQAREFWKEVKGAEIDAQYWQQDNGKWTSMAGSSK